MNQCIEHHFGMDGKCTYCKIAHRYYVTVVRRYQTAQKDGDKFGDKDKLRRKLLCKMHYDAQ